MPHILACQYSASLSVFLMCLYVFLMCFACHSIYRVYIVKILGRRLLENLRQPFWWWARAPLPVPCYYTCSSMYLLLLYTLRMMMMYLLLLYTLRSLPHREDDALCTMLLHANVSAAATFALLQSLPHTADDQPCSWLASRVRGWPADRGCQSSSYSV